MHNEGEETLNRSSGEAVAAPSLEGFKVRLDGALKNLV